MTKFIQLEDAIIPVDNIALITTVPSGGSRIRFKSVQHSHGATGGSSTFYYDVYASLEDIVDALEAVGHEVNP